MYGGPYEALKRLMGPIAKKTREQVSEVAHQLSTPAGQKMFLMGMVGPGELGPVAGAAKRAAGSTVREKLERLYGSDEALGVRYNEAEEMSVLPNGKGATTCTNCADYIVKQHGGGRVVGYGDKTNPSAGATGDFPGSGHDFAILEDRYIVDPWVKETSGTSQRAVFDMTDPADQAEIRRLYGDPKVWEQMKGPESPVPLPLGFNAADRAGKSAERPRGNNPLTDSLAVAGARRVGTAAVRVHVPGEVEPRTYTGQAHPMARIKAEDELGDLLDDNFEPRFKQEDGFLDTEGKWMTRQEAYAAAKKNKQIGGNARAVANVKRSGQMKAEALRAPAPQLTDLPTPALPSDAEIAEKIARLQKRLGSANGDYADQLKQDLQILQKRAPKTDPEKARPGNPMADSLAVAGGRAIAEKGFGLGGHVPEQKPLTYFRGPKTKPQDLSDAYEMSRKVFDARGPFRKWLKAGGEFPGASPWYDTREMYRDAADEIGEDAAAKRVNGLLGGFMPASTALSKPPSNLKRAFLWEALARHKLITPEMVRSQKIVMPKPFGHIAQTTAHQPALARLLEHGDIDATINPKPASFGQDLTGNTEAGTFDTVMGEIAREIDPKMNRFFSGGEEGKSPKAWAYGPMERGLADAAHDAAKRGLIDFDDVTSPVGPYQSLGWHGQTRSADYGSMIDIYRRLRKESAKLWGVSEKRANEMIWKEGRVPGLPLDSPLLMGTVPLKKILK